VAGQEEGEGLVPQLARAHLAAIVVARLQQERQQVLAIFPAGAPPVDQPVDDRVESTDGAAAAPDGGGGQPVRQQQLQVARAAALLVGQRQQGRGDLARLAHHVCPEQGARHVRQGQLGHLVVHLACLAIRPGHQPTLGRLDHVLAIAGNPLAVERRLDQPTLAQPQRPVAGDQAVAEQSAESLDHGALDEGALLGDQDLLDERGVVQEHQPEGAEAQGHRIAVLAGAPLQEGQRLAGQLGQVPEHQMAARRARRADPTADGGVEPARVEGGVLARCLAAGRHAEALPVCRAARARVASSPWRGACACLCSAAAIGAPAGPHRASTSTASTRSRVGKRAPADSWTTSVPSSPAATEHGPRPSSPRRRASA
jgi:hypothetical protein